MAVRIPTRRTCVAAIAALPLGLALLGPGAATAGAAPLLEADFTAGYNGIALNLVASAVIGGIPFEIVDIEIPEGGRPLAVVGLLGRQ